MKIEHTRINPGLESRGKFCVLAGVGFTWSLCALLITLAVWILLSPVNLDANGQPIEEAKTISQWLLLGIGWLSLFGVIGGPAASSIAISKIQSARGALYGLLAAVIGLYLLPLAIIDVIILALGDNFLRGTLESYEGNVKSLILLFAVIAILSWNIYVVKRAYKRLSQTITPEGTQTKPV